LVVVAVTLLLAACTNPGRRPAGPTAKASGLEQLHAEPVLAQPPGSTLVLLNERAASQGVLGDSSAYVTTFWASPMPISEVAAFYHRAYGVRYGLHAEVDTPSEVILSGFAPGQTANVRVDITTTRPEARLRDEQPATSQAIPPDTRSFSQVTVSSP
jgi:hypothetical protein